MDFMDECREGRFVTQETGPHRRLPRVSPGVRGEIVAATTVGKVRSIDVRWDNGMVDSFLEDEIREFGLRLIG